MMKNVFFALAVCSASLASGYAEVKLEKQEGSFKLHNLFQSNMVVQRDKPIVVWGWGKAGSQISVSFAGKQTTATVAKDGSWKVNLPAMSVSVAPQTMTIKNHAGKSEAGSNHVVTLENVLLGDVWVVAGQSNMQHPLSNVEGGQLEIVSAHLPKMRLLTVPPVIDDKAKTNFPIKLEGEKETGAWKVCSPKTVPAFSAIGYAFGRRLHSASQVPIGLIDVSRWGTTVESWTPRSVLKEMDNKAVKALLEDWQQKIENFNPQKDLESRIARYKRHRPDGTNPPTELDPGPQANQNYPGNCFNSFISPIAGFPVKGAIYHQGFNNARADAAELYQPVFTEMIKAWRVAFNDLKLPFGIISLCTDNSPQTLENYCESMMNHGIYVREAQYKTFLDFYKAGDQNVGFASSFNLRHAWFHPQKKLPAGERIARWALASQYGLERSIHWKPPMLTKMEVVEGAIHLHFDKDVTTEERGEEIEGFAIAAEDKKYQPAKAEGLVISRDKNGKPKYQPRVLVLNSPHVLDPIHFRYAWGRNPMGNLRASGNPQRHIAFATQRSDDWAYWDVPYLELPADQRESRQALEKMRSALRYVDLERRVFDARKLIEQEGDRLKELEAQLKK